MPDDGDRLLVWGLAAVIVAVVVCICAVAFMLGAGG